MIEINQKQNCSGCHACYNICPVNSIEMIEDNEGFLYPKVDTDKCIGCNKCEKVCPMINSKEIDNITEAFACINNDDEIRAESSSGGIFTLLAEHIINDGGVVFGAAFDENFNLIHSYTQTIDGIADYRGSKYLQSRINEVYKKVKAFVEAGTKVLFTGTPCQIAGLLFYLGREYDNLICVDIICHGTPSPKVFKMYKTELEKEYGSKAKKIEFRNKKYGWKKFSMMISFDNNAEYLNDLNTDVFMRGFLQNLYLRPSCYACKSKSLKRLSDITIADFWGIENVAPNLDDDKGTSLVLVNSYKGKNMITKLENKISYKKVYIEDGIKYNPSAMESVNYNPKRDEFFKNLNCYRKKISKLIKKYTEISFAKKVYNKTNTMRRLLWKKILLRR
jgi:coenzyme F420-reducing hydrogenase beta subunit